VLLRIQERSTTVLLLFPNKSAAVDKAKVNRAGRKENNAVDDDVVGNADNFVGDLDDDDDDDDVDSRTEETAIYCEKIKASSKRRAEGYSRR
jgi:hypothetical protein